MIHSALIIGKRRRGLHFPAVMSANFSKMIHTTCSAQIFGHFVEKTVIHQFARAVPLILKIFISGVRQNTIHKRRKIRHLLFVSQILQEQLHLNVFIFPRFYFTRKQAEKKDVFCRQKDKTVVKKTTTFSFALSLSQSNYSFRLKSAKKHTFLRAYSPLALVFT